MESIDKDYLMHHGVKGMKWGVRRYQNPDGSLTDAGRRKYLTESGGLTKAGYKAVKKGVKEGERLKRRANVFEQLEDVKKYRRRAKTAGKVAAALATGAATGVATGATGVAAGVGGASIGAAGVAAYSKIRQKMAEKNIRDIVSEEATKRYKEHTQRLLNAFGSKTVKDVRNFDRKKFSRDLEKLGTAENKVANLESHKNRVYKGDPKNGSYFYDKPIAEAKAARDAQYNKMASNAVARGKLEGKYGYKDGANTYYKDKKKKKG